MDKPGFDNRLYLEKQSEQILKRIGEFGDKLYLEFGGKLFDDLHASRVLPGFEPDIKIRLLATMADKAEIVFVINAADIEQSKMRGDLGITYDADLLRLIDAFRAEGLYVGSVVISQYAHQQAADKFKRRLEQLDVKVYLHYPIEGYPTNLSLMVSDDGYGRNDYVETERPLVVVTAPGPGSGKLATCLSQLYHDSKRGIKAGYAKFETFPIWNLPLKHPVNLAYEAATADLDDVNMIDPFHLEAYGITTVNYNRDVEAFPVLSTLFERILGTSPYKSPTDMGVNMAGYCITDDDIVSLAARKEIIRRYFDAACCLRRGLGTPEALQKTELLLQQADADLALRPCIQAALSKAEATDAPAVAIELPDKKVVTGKTSALLGASSAAVLNALKELGGIPADMLLLSPIVIEPIQKLKTTALGNHNPRLHIDEILIALSISAATNTMIAKALDQLPKLRSCEAHSTVILSPVDIHTFRKLGVNITCEPVYQTKKLYHA